MTTYFECKTGPALLRPFLGYELVGSFASVTLRGLWTSSEKTGPRMEGQSPLVFMSENDVHLNYI